MRFRKPVKLEESRISVISNSVGLSLGSEYGRRSAEPSGTLALPSPPATGRRLRTRTPKKRTSSKAPSLKAESASWGKVLSILFLIVSGALFPPFGLLLLAGWLVYRKKPKPKAHRLTKEALQVATTDPQRALPLIELAHILDSSNNTALYAAGYIAHEAGDHTMAYRFLEELRRHVPFTPEMNLLLGHAYFCAERHEEAIEILQQIPEAFGQHTKALLLLGKCFAAKGEYDAAIEVFKRGPLETKSLDEELKELHYQLARNYEKLGFSAAAKRHYRRVYTTDVKYRDVAERWRNPGIA